MSNKIHQELCRIAKEILEAEKPSDYQKIYDQTLLLFEQLILIKNSKGFEIDFWEDLESKFDKEIDFIEIQDKKGPEEQIENNDRQELPPLIDTIKEIVKEIPEPQPAAEDFLKVSHRTFLAGLTRTSHRRSPSSLKRNISTFASVLSLVA